MTDDIRTFVPSGLPLLTLELIDKLDGKAWCKGMLPELIRRRGKTTAPQVTVAINRLFHFGMIERSGESPGNGTGRCRKHWRTTDKGKTVLQEAVRLYDGFQRRPDMYDQAPS